ncbi:hypothetical protein LPB140_03595 [Sphingorhabdus lutea]|uniref:Uncharacterized protein n=1 Tax=Sphingorhabdus lutea TaxID=1913578 RepID=A0A1L3JA89_9SPHN|nr:hypothetical protein [Sphingorhabdus lutea]APG62050.1 hypothetical protein LPB140_03595 [Sphingorhabdus lutea]
MIASGIFIGVVTELAFQAIDIWFRGGNITNVDCYEWGEVIIAGGIGAFGGSWVNNSIRLTKGSMLFKNVSRRLRRTAKMVNKKEDLHHWLLPRRWEKAFNGRAAHIVNHPLNLNRMPRGAHNDLHKLNNNLDKIWRGAPQPVKYGAGLGASGAAIDLSNGSLE